MKADSTIKRKIFSLWRQQSVPWRLTHLSNIMQTCVSDFLPSDDYQPFYDRRRKLCLPFMVKAENLSLTQWWLSTLLWQEAETLFTFHGEGRKPFSLVLHYRLSMRLHGMNISLPYLLINLYSQIPQIRTFGCPHLFFIHFLVIPAEYIHKQCVFRQPNLWRWK